MASSTDKPSSPPHIPNIPTLASVPPPNEGLLRSLPTLPSVASPGSSMETAPMSLSSEEGSDGSLSHSSSVEIEFSSLLTDIRGRYDGQELHPPSHSFPKTPLSPTDSATPPVDEGAPPVDISLSEYESLDDSVPLASLKKDFPLLKEEQRRNSKKQQKVTSKAFKKAMKDTWVETSDEKSKGEDGESNLTLMAKSEKDSDNDSSESSNWPLATRTSLSYGIEKENMLVWQNINFVATVDIRVMLDMNVYPG
ncbi:hypothetical protein HAX54_011988 [Datura stramonium]|uniref:Uncharacterized protein n=1 Tax=Datura stramonium TaxID=4076 RepID=A0ABS8Y538_DATST|nr:hypothetical protein [Datura stramonium]